MSDVPLLSAQVRAARGLLGWSQDYLARGARVNRLTIVDLEAGRRQPHEATMAVIMTEFAAAGVAFTTRGVEFTAFPAPAYVPTGIRLQATA
jgi:DNA-binding XRE family transcriptional regulator